MTGCTCGESVREGKEKGKEGGGKCEHRGQLVLLESLCVMKYDLSVMPAEDFTKLHCVRPLLLE